MQMDEGIRRRIRIANVILLNFNFMLNNFYNILHISESLILRRSRRFQLTIRNFSLLHISSPHSVLEKVKHFVLQLFLSLQKLSSCFFATIT